MEDPEVREKGQRKVWVCLPRATAPRATRRRIPWTMRRFRMRRYLLPTGRKPPTRVVNPDATISERPRCLPPACARCSGIYIKEAVLQPGDLIGARYEILALLGEGGMGSVYKALDREVERTVALKLIRPELASNPAILARFKQELLTAHQVTHKNVIRIYDMAEADGVKFITMEFVEGQDLRPILMEKGSSASRRRSRLSGRFAWRWKRRTARASSIAT